MGGGAFRGGGGLAVGSGRWPGWTGGTGDGTAAGVASDVGETEQMM